MNRITKLLAPWFDEKEASAREFRTEAIKQEALIVLSHTDRVIQSYRAASKQLERNHDHDR